MELMAFDTALEAQDRRWSDEDYLSKQLIGLKKGKTKGLTL